MLMKMTPRCVNFINILFENFLGSFSLVNFDFVIFWGQKYWHKSYPLNVDEIDTSLDPAYMREFTALHLLTISSE